MNITNFLQLFFTEVTAKVPQRSTVGSAGFDVFAPSKTLIPAKGFAEVTFPFEIREVGKNTFEVELFLRSSFGIKKHIRLWDKKANIRVNKVILNLNEENTITLFNDSNEDLIIEKDEHFVQFVLGKENAVHQPLTLERVIDSEWTKTNPLKARIIEKEPNVFAYVLEEELVFGPNEMIKAATGLKGKIADGQWFGIYMNEEVEKTIFLANGIAVIDKDYHGNPSNDGNCLLALVNATDQTQKLEAGTELAIMYAKEYFVFEDEIKTNVQRTGGVGHTSK